MFQNFVFHGKSNLRNQNKFNFRVDIESVLSINMQIKLSP